MHVCIHVRMLHDVLHDSDKIIAIGYLILIVMIPHTKLSVCFCAFVIGVCVDTQFRIYCNKHSNNQCHYMHMIVR